MPRKPPPGAGPGRPKGCQNKVTLSVKEAIEKALANKGGHLWLEKLADEEPAAFASLVGKLLPKNVTLEGNPDTPLTMRVVFHACEKPESSGG